MPRSIPLRPDVDVYRAAYKKRWIVPGYGKLLPDAFKLRKSDVDRGGGLSVLNTGKCPTLSQAEKLIPPFTIYALGGLNVGAILQLELGLSVNQDGKHHASVAGLPYNEDNNDLIAIQRVNDYAYALSEISRICHP